MKLSFSLSLASALCLALLPACADDTECDPGQEIDNGVCRPASAGSAGAGGSSAAGAPNSSGEAGAGEGGAAATSFGASCTDDVEHSECGGDATYCAKQPGQATGYCTATGCVEDPSVCPADWGCMDLSVFSAELPSVCTQP